MTTKSLTAIGDSLTDWNNSWGIDGFRMWVAVLARLLRAEGLDIRGRGFGVGGETTTQFLARVDAMQFYDTPDLGIIYGGPNDPFNSVNQATTQANHQAMIKSLKYGAVGTGLGTGVTVATQAQLPALGELGQRYVVLADSSTTGGAVATHSSQAATITGTLGGSPQSVWEFRNPLAGEAGWGRVAVATTAPTKVKRIAVVSAGYLNYSTGGDTLTTPYASYAPVRAAQAAAVTAENVNVSGVASVVFIDLYAYLKARITAGTDPDASSAGFTAATSWHVADANQHHNAYGNMLVAMAVRAGLPAAWITALGA